MKKHNQRHLEEVSYEAPSANTLDILSEGLLCVSAPGSTIDPGTEDDWGTLN